MSSKRVKIDGPNDAEKFKKESMTYNPHTTVEYGWTAEESNHDEKNSGAASKIGESGTYSRGKNPGERDSSDFTYYGQKDGKARPYTTEHPEKQGVVPAPGGQRDASTINAGGKSGVKRTEISAPNTHVSQPAGKGISQMELAAKRGRQNQVEFDAKQISGAARKAIDVQQIGDGSANSPNGNGKRRATNYWGVSEGKK